MTIDMRGQEILGYRVVELLGEGGMATVWRADHVALRRSVAVKVLNPLLAQDRELISRFLGEAQIQADLKHPNIVKIENFSLDPLAMVMEYVEGRTLDEMIGREVGPIPFQTALPLMLQILDAVGFAQERRFIHRDLKPANVMVTPDNQAKVMDFGIAKIMGGSRMTRTGAVMGTAAYMSPEQIKGAKNVDVRSDIYSLGVTFYEMLAGRTPFESEADSDSDFELRNAQVFRAPPDPRTFYPGIPEGAVQVVLRALAKSPADRHQTAEDLRSALESVSAAEKAPRPVPVRQPPVAAAHPAAAPAPSRRQPAVSLRPSAADDSNRTFSGYTVRRKPESPPQPSVLVSPAAFSPEPKPPPEPESPRPRYRKSPPDPVETSAAETLSERAAATRTSRTLLVVVGFLLVVAAIVGLVLWSSRSRAGSQAPSSRLALLFSWRSFTSSILPRPALHAN